MADKKDDQNLEYWREKMAGKLPDLKYLLRAVGGFDKNISYPDEETFLITVLRLIAQRLGTNAEWLSSAISQPNGYEQMLAYRYLKDAERLTETRKLAERMIALAFQIDTCILNLHAEKDELVTLYNKIIKDVFSLESEYIGITKFILDNLEKNSETKEKDVYIG